MKKLSALLLVATLLAGCGSATKEAPVDTYTSASTTKINLTDNDLNTAKQELMAASSDLASLADTKKADYKAPEGETIVQIMSTNPDGSVCFSTIHAWKMNEDNTIEVELTHGQNALNLIEDNDRGSILAHVNGSYYLVHLKTSKVEELKYNDEAYQNGEFNSSYSGAKDQLSEYHITFDVLSIEKAVAAMFN